MMVSITEFYLPAYDFYLYGKEGSSFFFPFFFPPSLSLLPFLSKDSSDGYYIETFRKKIRHNAGRNMIYMIWMTVLK